MAKVKAKAAAKKGSKGVRPSAKAKKMVYFFGGMVSSTTMS